MNNLRDIRRRLHSVENVKKITDTMERVAAARLKNAQAKAEKSRPYINKLKHILENVSEGNVSHPLFKHRDVRTVGVVVIAGDRGLSGSYNSTVLAKADKFLEKYDADQVEIIPMGRKAVAHYKKKQWKIHSQYTQWADDLSYQRISHISDALVNAFLSEEMDEVWLIYTRYISVMRREVVVEKFLNVGKESLEKESTPQQRFSESKPEKFVSNYIFEPSAEEILAEILPRYCVTRIQTALFESYASELAARIMAMQTASRNSEEMIEKLTLIKNKTRQRDITREMIEIATGANTSV